MHGPSSAHQHNNGNRQREQLERCHLMIQPDVMIQHFVWPRIQPQQRLPPAHRTTPTIKAVSVNFNITINCQAPVRKSSWEHKRSAAQLHCVPMADVMVMVGLLKTTALTVTGSCLHQQAAANKGNTELNGEIPCKQACLLSLVEKFWQRWWMRLCGLLTQGHFCQVQWWVKKKKGGGGRYG